MRSHIILWMPRVFGILVCVFLGTFSLDAFSNGKPMGEAVVAFAVHIAPILVLLTVVALSWRWPLVGGVVFTCLAAAYAIFARTHPSWIVAIGGPLLVVGILFVSSWLDGYRRV